MNCWRCWQDTGKKLGRSSKDCSDDDVIPDSAMGDVGDVSWVCVKK